MPAPLKALCAERDPCKKYARMGAGPRANLPIGGRRRSCLLGTIRVRSMPKMKRRRRRERRRRKRDKWREGRRGGARGVAD